MDTGLRVFRLCLLWGDVADGGVDAPPIVIAFDIGEQVAPRGIAIGVLAVVDREQGGRQALESAGYSVRSLTTSSAMGLGKT